MANGKLNGNVKWIGIGRTIVLLVGNIIWQSSAISGAVNRHERRIERNERLILDVKEKLADIANNQKWMMKRMK